MGPTRYAALAVNHPARREVLQWGRRRLHDEDAPERKQRPPDLETDLPPWYQAVLDANDDNKTARWKSKLGPLKLIRAVKLADHLRDTRQFQPVLAHTTEYLAGADNTTYFPDNVPEPAAAPPRPKHWGPHRRTLERARLRLDATSMLIERREWAMWRADLENPIISIHIQSDASPVTGTELQGMLLDVCFLGGAILRRYLPPMSLAYGFYAAIDKTVALLWSLWLVAGPGEEDIRWVCYRIKSFTTDQGTEILTALTPDILHCFFCWLQGRALDSMARSVPSTTRLFHGVCG